MMSSVGVKAAARHQFSSADGIVCSMLDVALEAVCIPPADQGARILAEHQAMTALPVTVRRYAYASAVRYTRGCEKNIQILTHDYGNPRFPPRTRSKVGTTKASTGMARPGSGSGSFSYRRRAGAVKNLSYLSTSTGEPLASAAYYLTPCTFSSSAAANFDAGKAARAYGELAAASRMAVRRGSTGYPAYAAYCCPGAVARSLCCVPECAMVASLWTPAVVLGSIG